MTYYPFENPMPVTGVDGEPVDVEVGTASVLAALLQQLIEQQKITNKLLAKIYA